MSGFSSYAAADTLHRRCSRMSHESVGKTNGQDSIQRSAPTMNSRTGELIARSLNQVIFCERGVNHCGSRPTGRAKSCERGDKGWFDEGFLWLGQEEWDRTGNDFEAGARRRVGSGLDHRLKRGGGRAKWPISAMGLWQHRQVGGGVAGGACTRGGFQSSKARMRCHLVLAAGLSQPK